MLRPNVEKLSEEIDYTEYILTWDWNVVKLSLMVPECWKLSKQNTTNGNKSRLMTEVYLNYFFENVIQSLKRHELGAYEQTSTNYRQRV